MLKVIPEKPSINIAEWKEMHPNYCAVIERDLEKPNHGWVRYRGSRPYSYSLDSLTGNPDFDMFRFNNIDNLYEIIPKTYKLPESGSVKLSPKRMREVIKAMNTEV